MTHTEGIGAWERYGNLSQIGTEETHAGTKIGTWPPRVHTEIYFLSYSLEVSRTLNSLLIDTPGRKDLESHAS